MVGFFNYLMYPCMDYFFGIVLSICIGRNTSVSNKIKTFKYEVLEYMTSNNKKIFTILGKKGYRIVSSIDKEFILFVCNLLNKDVDKWLIKEDNKYRLNNKRIIKDLYNHRCVFYLP